MRTVKHLPNGIERETDLVKFPDSTVVNETENNEGTPVVREIYGDVLTNLYKILRLTKETANGFEDNEVNGYQLVNALRKFTNELNDIEQQLNLTGTQFSINIDLSILPNKYVCFARAVETYVSSTVYTFKGTNSDVFPFSAPVPFKSGDVVLVIIDTSGVRAYSIVPSAAVSIPKEIYTPLGLPVAFNNSDKIWYQEEGYFLSDQPESHDLQAAIRFAASDGTLLVYEMLVVNSFVYCLVFAPNTLAYSIHRFSLTDLSSPSLVNITGESFPIGVDRRPNIYTDGETLYITNQTGNSDSDFVLSKYTFDHILGTLTAVGSISLDSSFAKSTNCVVKNNLLFELINGQLNKYDLGTGVKTPGSFFAGNVGLLFNYKNNFYYTNGEVGKLWNLN
ncbi:hypothetical protein [Pedobacter ureilyticus]|uniref:Uncharacterized protein n=1 Tax=Pedobacter ureilyticus TaxID=1393051 RepID=A0ABW9J3Z3_9SPHI|nr:hypothetical protein [Pedobacter helvus]